MTDFRLVTTSDRVFEVSTGDPLPQLAPGEYLANIQRSDMDAEHPTDLDQSDIDWVLEHVAPLMRAWNTEAL